MASIDIFLTLPLVNIEEAGMDYESLVQIKIEIDTILLSDLSQLERQSLIEIKQDLAQKLEDIFEWHREEQLDNDMDAQAYRYMNLNVEQEEEAEDEEEEQEEEQEDVYGEEREE